MGYLNEYDFLDTMGTSESESVLYHSTFLGNWQLTVEGQRLDGRQQGWITYGEKRTIHRWDDIRGFLSITDMHPDNQNENRNKFDRFILTLPQISLAEPPNPYTWYNTTKSGINLRPGRIYGSNRVPDPVVMEGENTHGIVAGTTGSGKSVFLNNLILNLMAEYPPWELELYLADFKKVELSRYLNKENHEAPHVRACAATSEIEYVQSLICFIKKRMDDRQELFKRLGIRDIESFRNDYPQVTMPRILFLIDEFQQLFLETNLVQKSVIEDLITSITRLGRAQGVHLLFASQDMSGALSQKQLTNFNLRFALHCDANISNDILGNSAAVSLKRGQVIAKTKSSENVVYKVPLVDPKEVNDVNEEEYFYKLLKEFKENADRIQYEYRKTQKFYEEDKQLELNTLETLLNRPAIKRIRAFSDRKGIHLSQENFMSFVFGRKVVYSEAEYDIENLFIDYAKNRCLLCLSGKHTDLAYFQKLVAINIKTMVNKANCSVDVLNRPFQTPFFYDLNPVVATLYSEEERMQDFDCMQKPFSECSKEEIAEFKNLFFYARAEELEDVYYEYRFLKEVLRCLLDMGNKNAKDCCREYLRYSLFMDGVKDVEKQEECVAEMFEWLGLNSLANDDSNILSYIESNIELFAPDELLVKDIKELLTDYYRYRIAGIEPTCKLFAPRIVWITGIENVERLPQWFSEFASNALNYNMFVMFFSTTAVDYNVKQAVNYVFVSGNDPKLYDDYLGKRISDNSKGLKFYGLIKNTNQQFAFKKYRSQSNDLFMKCIDFDKELKDVN